ncbi:PREDICTED: spore wall protein 2-like [Amphimedon queenslandica]|uniref:DUSP domain-containing protein n=1 Tax=Amphimedon queenslandica TaxID=400682 RepID=A0AAN0JE41_AMPQE|nr:PREDICTED: spore wall protein 2-like [Amphimedon queenslandica]|eukprot:XP_019855259.1 PREDICTED: spore wall protein 2-like [Amphimedon queenslandica]
MDRAQLEPLLLPDVKETGKELGRGAYGVVTEVIVSETTCAAKKLHDVIVQDYTLKRFGDEVLLHSQQRHPNIVQLIGVYYPPRSQLPMLQQVGGDRDNSTRDGEQLTPGGQGTHHKQQVGGDRDNSTRDGEQLTPGGQGTHHKQQVGGDRDNSTRDGEQLTPGGQGTHHKQQVGGDRDNSTRDGEQLTPGGQETDHKQQVGGDRDNSTRHGEQLTPGGQGTHHKQQVGGDRDNSTRHGEQLTPGGQLIPSGQGTHHKQQEGGDRKRLMRDRERFLSGSESEQQITHSKEQAEDPGEDFRTRRMSLKRTGLRNSFVVKQKDFSNFTGALQQQEGKSTLLTKPPKEGEPKHSIVTKANEQQPVKTHEECQAENKVSKAVKHLTADHDQLTPGGQETHHKQQEGGDRDNSTRDGEQLTPGGQGTHHKQQVGGDRDNSTRDGEQLTPGGQGTHHKQQVGGDRDNSTKDGEQLTPGGQETRHKQQAGGDRDNSTRDGEQLTPGGQGTHRKQQVGGDRDNSTRDGEQLTPGGQGTHRKQQVGGDRDNSTRDGEQLTPGGQETHHKQQVGGDRDNSTRHGEQLTPGGQETDHKQQVGGDQDNSTRDGDHLTPSEQGTHYKQQGGGDRKRLIRDRERLLSGSESEQQITHSKEKAEDPGEDFRTRRMSLKRTGLRDSLVVKQKDFSNFTGALQQQQDKSTLLTKPPKEGEPKHSTVTKANEQQPVKTHEECQAENKVSKAVKHLTADHDQLTPGGRETHHKQQEGGDGDHSARDGKRLNGSDTERQIRHPKEQTENLRTDFIRSSFKKKGLHDSRVLKETSNFPWVLQQQDEAALLKTPPKEYEPKHSTETKANEQQPVKTREEYQGSIVRATKVSVKSSQALKDAVVPKKPDPSSIPLASIQAQKERIQPYLSQRLRKGDNWCLVDVKWFRQWKKYTGFDSWDQETAGQASAHPGPVDNGTLFKDPDSEELKNNLKEGENYALLPEPAYNLLVKWYGLSVGSRPIIRCVVEYSGPFAKKLVEVYLYLLKLCVYPKTDDTRMHSFSQVDSVGHVMTVMKQQFNIPDTTECRICKQFMRTYLPLENLKQAISEAGIRGGQTILLEKRNQDGTWPRDIKRQQ